MSTNNNPIEINNKIAEQYKEPFQDLLQAASKRYPNSGYGQVELLQFTFEVLHNRVENKIAELEATIKSLKNGSMRIVKLRNGTEIDRTDLINSLIIKKETYEEMKKEILKE